MRAWSNATIVFLIITCLQIMLVVLPVVSLFLWKDFIPERLYELVFQILPTAAYFAVNVFLAAVLHKAQESFWRVVAFVLIAILSVAYMILLQLHTQDMNIWTNFGYLNTFAILYATIQCFLIKAPSFKVSFSINNAAALILLLINMATPYLLAKFAYSYSYARYLSLFAIIPLITQLYLLYTIYNYFNTVYYKSQNPWDYNKPML